MSMKQVCDACKLYCQADNSDFCCEKCPESLEEFKSLIKEIDEHLKLGYPASDILKYNGGNKNNHSANCKLDEDCEEANRERKHEVKQEVLAKSTVSASAPKVEKSSTDLMAYLENIPQAAATAASRPAESGRKIEYRKIKGDAFPPFPPGYIETMVTDGTKMNDKSEAHALRSTYSPREELEKGIKTGEKVGTEERSVLGLKRYTPAGVKAPAKIVQLE